MGKTNNSGATGGDERAVEFTTGSKAAEEPVDGYDEQGGVESSGQAGCLIRDAGYTERQHRLPVIEHRLFEPRRALQRGCNPIGALEHFARHLRIAGFVGAEQAEGAEAIKEEESAERCQQQHVGAISWIRPRIRSLHSHKFTPGAAGPAPTG